MSDSEAGHCHVERDGAVLVLSLERPPRNAFTLDMLVALRRAAEGGARDPAVRAICVTGRNGHFCAGADVKGFAASQAADEHIADLTLHYHAAITALHTAPKPVLAAVCGVAAGGGFSLSLACDVAVCSEQARFVYAYSKIGLGPDGGASWTLPRLVGTRRAFWLAAKSPELRAEEALQLGLVQQILPEDGFEGGWRALARELAAGPTQAFATTKALLAASAQHTLPAQLELERAGICKTAATRDAREGFLAFTERRTPYFEG